MPSRLPRRSLLTTAVLVVGALIGSQAATAGPIEPDQEKAAAALAAIADAQARANEAAAAYSEAETKLGQLEDEARELQRRHDELAGVVAELRVDSEQAAVELFMQSGATPMAVLTELPVFSDDLQAHALAATVQESAADSLDEYQTAQLELDQASADLAANERAVAEQQAAHDAARDDAIAEVAHLQEVEEERLADEQVAIAVEIQRRAEEEARRREEQRRAEEAARLAAEEEARQRAAQQAAVQQAAAEEAQRQANQSAIAQVATPAAPDAPADGGGSSSGGGERSAPFSNGGMICPVDGSRAYADTWGAARSGGRSHEGTDLMARTGTPLVAVVSGSVQFSQNRLGGNAAWLSGENGTRYYYAHLDSFAGSSRGVSQGEVIGYVGMTGNAGAPHLHFEVHPGGGDAVNPFPYVVAAGC